MNIIGPEDCGTVTPAYVMSTSYYFDEAQFTPAYEQRQCAEYAKVSPDTVLPNLSISQVNCVARLDGHNRPVCLRGQRCFWRQFSMP